LVELSLKSTGKSLILGLLLRTLGNVSIVHLSERVVSGHVWLLHHGHKGHVTTLVQIGIHWSHSLRSGNEVSRELLRRRSNGWLWLTWGGDWSNCRLGSSSGNRLLASSLATSTSFTSNLAADAAKDAA